MATFKQLMDEYLDEFLKQNLFMGNLLVSSKGKTVYERSMGMEDIEHDIPLSENSRFTFYSMSKAFCAVGIMLLKDKGLVDIDEHPKKYLPELSEADENLTIRIGLRHMSGIRDFCEVPETLAMSRTRYKYNFRKMVEACVKAEPHFPAGTSVRYANIGFMIAALIIENVTGMKYPEYMKKEVFEPLGMLDTCIDYDGLLIKNRAHGYEIMGDHYASTVKDNIEMFAAGDVVGTARDMYKFSRAIYEKRLLSEESWEEVLKNDSNPYGLGCVTYGKDAGRFTVQHNGGHYGFRTYHTLIFDSDFDIVLLSNTGYGNSRSTIPNAVYQAWDMCGGNVGETTEKVEMDKGFINAQSETKVDDGFMPKKPPKVKLSKEEEDYFLGEYTTLTVEKWGDDEYIIHMGSGIDLIAYAVSPQKLQNSYIDEAYDIVTNEKGDVLIWDGRKL